MYVTSGELTETHLYETFWRLDQDAFRGHYLETDGKQKTSI